MEKIFFLVVSMGMYHVSLAQDFNIGHRQETFIDVDRQNRAVLAEIYYPSFEAGDDVPVAGQIGETFPVIIFGHGFVMEWSAYANFWNTLVPHGYILALPRTETGISPNHLTFGQDIAFLVKALQEEGQNPASLFFNKVDTTSCVMGHSMGGGSSFLSVQYNPAITAVVNFAAAETNPSAVAACNAIHIPVLIFAGANDCITPPAAHQVLMYDALPSTCKSLVTIAGASHCQFAEQNVFCSFGELTCTPSPEISRAVQHQLVDTLLIPWLDDHLKRDCLASARFQSILASSDAYTFQQACEPCIPLNIDAVKQIALFRAYPNPNGGTIYLRAEIEAVEIAVRMFNESGTTVFSQLLPRHSEGQWQFNPALPNGIYFLEVQYGDKLETITLVIQ